MPTLILNAKLKVKPAETRNEARGNGILDGWGTYKVHVAPFGKSEFGPCRSCWLLEDGTHVEEGKVTDAPLTDAGLID